MADELHTTPNHIVISWLAHGDPPIIPIIGGSTREQIRQNIAAVSLELSPQQRAKLTAAGQPTADDATRS